VSAPRGVAGVHEEAQRRRIRRTAVLLALVALGIYVAFIASGVMQARG
jgi:hypothetical protein